MPARAPSWFSGALLLSALACAPPAYAQSPEERKGYEEVHPRQIARLSAQQAKGKRFSITYVKFLKVFEGELKLYGGKLRGRSRTAPLQGLLRVGATLEKKLQSLQDSEGTTLVPRESNIQVFASARIAQGKLVLVVDRVVKLGDQAERFAAMAATLEEKDALGRRNLARRVERATRYFPEERKACEALLERLRKEARAITIGALPELPEGAQERIDVGVKVRDIELVAEVYEHEGVAAETREAAAKALHEQLQARLYLGKWHPYGEYKRMLGFLPSDRKWVRQERVWLEEAVEREKARLRRNEPRQPFTKFQLKAYMGEGRLVRGMVKEWVIAALKAKHGEMVYPETVIRVRELQKQGKALEWEVWVLPSGLQVYFCNGLVTEKVEPEAKDDAPDVRDDEEPAKKEEGETPDEEDE